MSLIEWQNFYYDNFGWQTVIKGDNLLLKTGPTSITALEFHQQYEVYERFVEWDLKMIKPEYHDCVFATIGDHKALFFNFARSNVDSLKEMKSASDFITYNGAGPLYWTLHNVDGLVPVEPSPGCKWPVERKNLKLYFSQKSTFKEAAKDAVISALWTGTLFEGINKEGELRFHYDQKCIAECGELKQYPKVRALTNFLDRTKPFHYHDIMKLGLSPNVKQINEFIVNNIALIDHGCYWVVRMFDPETKTLDFQIMRDDAAKAMFKNAKFAAPAGKKRQPNLLEYIDRAEILNKIKFGRMNFNPCADIIDFYYRNENAVFNLFHGFRHTHTGKFDMGRVQRILDHFKAIYAPDDERLFNYLIRWMAWIVQKPNQKTMVCLVIRSLEGAGKTSWFDWFGKFVLGEGYYLKSIFDKIMGKFNGPLMGKLLTVINEVGNGELYGVHNKFKEMITDETIPIEKKNQDVITVNDFNNYVVCTNDDYPVKITPNDRRYCCIDGNPIFIGNHEYWSMCYREILTAENGADFYNYLMTIDTSEHPKNIVNTKARREMKIDSQPPPIKYLIDLARDLNVDIDIEGNEMYGNINRWKETKGITHNFTEDYCLKLVNKVIESKRVMINGARSRRYQFDREKLIIGLNRFLNDDIRELID
ncbi:phage integrase [Faustovirus]|nr:phage integrase [Faustovirus]AMN84417.1 phage integrase [Faustovirus]AMP44442.1 phage integrase [Faustovirus]